MCVCVCVCTGSDLLIKWYPFSLFSLGDLVKEQGLLFLVELAHTCIDRASASSLRDQIKILYARKES